MLCRTAIRVGNHVFKLHYSVGSVSDPVMQKGISVPRSERSGLDAKLTHFLPVSNFPSQMMNVVMNNTMCGRPFAKF